MLFFFVKSHPRVGVAIGDHVLDVSAVQNLFTGPIMSKNASVFNEVTTRLITTIQSY